MALSSSQLGILFLLAFCVLISATGFVAPYWERQHILSPDIKIAVGLWYGCADAPVYHLKKCVFVPWNLGGVVKDDTFFKAVRVLMAGSMLLQAMSIVVGFVTCLRRKTSARDVIIESILASLGGVSGIAAAGTFAAYTGSNYSPFSTDLEDLDEPLSLTKGFAFYLTCAGSSLTLLVGLVGPFAPRRHEDIKSTLMANASGTGIENPNFSMEPTMKQAHFEL